SDPRTTRQPATSARSYTWVRSPGTSWSSTGEASSSSWSRTSRPARWRRFRFAARPCGWFGAGATTAPWRRPPAPPKALWTRRRGRDDEVGAGLGGPLRGGARRGRVWQRDHDDRRSEERRVGE